LPPEVNIFSLFFQGKTGAFSGAFLVSVNARNDSGSGQSSFDLKLKTSKNAPPDFKKTTHFSMFFFTNGGYK
jgi:hypothetical protein